MVVTFLLSEPTTPFVINGGGQGCTLTLWPSLGIVPFVPLLWVQNAGTNLPCVQSQYIQRPFQILGLDIMQLYQRPKVAIFTSLSCKIYSPLVFPAPDQKTLRIVKLLAEEVVPTFGVLEALLTDRGTNLLSNLMLDDCNLLGIRKLNTTAYHPECDGLVERFDRNLKTMICTHVQEFGVNWDKYPTRIVVGISRCTPLVYW